MSYDHHDERARSSYRGYPQHNTLESMPSRRRSSASLAPTPTPAIGTSPAPFIGPANGTPRVPQLFPPTQVQQYSAPPQGTQHYPQQYPAYEYSYQRPPSQGYDYSSWGYSYPPLGTTSASQPQPYTHCPLPGTTSASQYTPTPPHDMSSSSQAPAPPRSIWYPPHPPAYDPNPSLGSALPIPLPTYDDPFGLYGGTSDDISPIIRLSEPGGTPPSRDHHTPRSTPRERSASVHASAQEGIPPGSPQAGQLEVVVDESGHISNSKVVHKIEKCFKAWTSEFLSQHTVNSWFNDWKKTCWWDHRRYSEEVIYEAWLRVVQEVLSDHLSTILNPKKTKKQPHMEYNLVRERARRNHHDGDSIAPALPTHVRGYISTTMHSSRMVKDGVPPTSPAVFHQSDHRPNNTYMTERSRQLAERDDHFMGMVNLRDQQANEYCAYWEATRGPNRSRRISGLDRTAAQFNAEASTSEAPLRLSRGSSSSSEGEDLSIYYLNEMLDAVRRVTAMYKDFVEVCFIKAKAESEDISTSFLDHARVGVDRVVARYEDMNEDYRNAQAELKCGWEQQDWSRGSSSSSRGEDPSIYCFNEMQDAVERVVATYEDLKAEGLKAKAEGKDISTFFLGQARALVDHVVAKYEEMKMLRLSFNLGGSSKIDV